MYRGDGQLITLRPTLDTGAYASGDVLFIPTEITDVMLDTKGMANLRTLVVLDMQDQKQAVDLLFFSEDPGSIGAANAALAMSDTAAALLLGHISIATGDYISGNANAYGTKLMTMLFQAIKNKKSLWVAGVCRSGTPTYAANGLIFKMLWERL